MGCFHKIFSNPITKIATDVGLALVPGGAPFIPVANAAETKLGGGSLGDSLKSGAETFAGQELLPAAGNLFSSAFPETAANLGITGGANSLTDLLGQTTGGGSFAGPGTIGGDLSSLFTGSPGLNGAPTADAFTNAARSTVSGSAASPPTSLSGYLPANGASIAGGGSPGGFFTAPTSAFGAPPTLDSSGIDKIVASIPTSSTGGNVTSLSDLFNPAGLLKGSLAALFAKNNSRQYDNLANAYGTAGANYQPFLQSGQAATKTLSDLLGTNGQAAAQAATQNWENTPGYQFALNQGLKALDAGAAARGMAVSGNNQQAEQAYGTGLANQYYNDYLNNLRNQAGIGLAGAQGVGAGQVGGAAAQVAGGNTQDAQYNNMLAQLLGFNPQLSLSSLFR